MPVGFDEGKWFVVAAFDGDGDFEALFGGVVVGKDDAMPSDLEFDAFGCLPEVLTPDKDLCGRS